MIQSETILGSKDGEIITIPDIDDKLVNLRLNIGDALLNGDNSQVWLENGNSERRLYLRRKPERNMPIGTALFSSLSDLVETLETGNYYIG